MISKKMKYALKALIYIAERNEGQVRTKDIAENARIPKKFLEQILLELKKGGIVHSKQGIAGGFHFLKQPADVTLAEVYRLIDGPIALLQCASKNFYEACDDCADVHTCKIRFALVQVRQQTLSVLENITIADLMNEERILENNFH
jgi:Rrf2 family protein